MKRAHLSLVACLVVVACGESEKPPAPKAGKLSVEPDKPVRIELGFCSDQNQVFVSGARARGQRPQDAEFLAKNPDAPALSALNRTVTMCFQKSRNASAEFELKASVIASGAIESVNFKGRVPAEIKTCISDAAKSVAFPPGDARTLPQLYSISIGPASPVSKRTKKLSKLQMRLKKLRRPTPAVPALSLPSPLKPYLAELTRCASKHQSEGGDAVVVDLAPQTEPKAHSAAGRKPLATCIGEALATYESSQTLRCPVAVGTTAPESVRTISLEGTTFTRTGDAMNRDQLESWLDEFNPKPRDTTPPVSLRQPLVVRVKPGDSLETLLQASYAAKNAGFEIALATNSGDRWTLVRNMELPWVPAFKAQSPRVELELAIHESGREQIRESIRKAPKGAVALIKVSRAKAISGLLPILRELQAAGIDEWTLADNAIKRLGSD